MAKVAEFNSDGEIAWRIKCPGCKVSHIFTTGFLDEASRNLKIERRKKVFGEKPHQPCPIWTFNGDIEKPTFRASMLSDRTLSLPHGKDVKPMRCHSFVTDGKIQFLDDCTHELRGQTVDLLDIS